MTDHTDELISKLRYQGKQYANGMRARGGYFIGKHWLEEVADRLEELNDLRQQDMARLARMREALEEAQALASGLLGMFGNEADIGIRYLLEIYERSLSETADIQAWIDGQGAQWQPIETAPKERAVDVWLQSDSNPDFGTRITNVVYIDGKWLGIPQHWQLSYVRPTNWMPLPAAPSARSTKGEG